MLNGQTQTDPMPAPPSPEEPRETVRIIIVDDHPVFLKGLYYILERQEAIQVVGEATNSEDAVRLVQRQRPDMAIVDLELPEHGGLWAIQQMLAVHPALKIIVLTASDRVEDLKGALQAGALGYLVKGANPAEMLDAILAVRSGNSYVTPKLAGKLIHLMTHPQPADPLAELTPRETQVLQLIAQGKTNFEIGRELGLAEKTVKQYNTSIFRKLDVRSRVEAALVARERGLV